jgi:broad specificity phosphatase PhoE
MFRHGQTEWSRDGRHTGRTDLDLLPEGEADALALRTAVAALEPGLVLCSPRLRARRTADLAGLVPYRITDDLQEWDYGDLEGLTSVQIRERYRDWTIWDGPWPGGETAGDVLERADRLIAEILGTGEQRVALVGHGHFSRVVAARWVGEDVSVGRWLDLDTATLSELGWAKGERVLRRWNVPVAPRDRGSPGGRDPAGS